CGSLDHQPMTKACRDTPKCEWCGMCEAWHLRSPKRHKFEAQKPIPCDDCGQSVPVWYAPSYIWNAVMPTGVGMLCANCFIARAEAAGIVCTGWTLEPQNYVQQATEHSASASSPGTGKTAKSESGPSAQEAAAQREENQSSPLAAPSPAAALWMCPVCGFDMDRPPADYHICPCCGTEFGYHDANATHEELRQSWIKTGPKWWRDSERPENWNPYEQLAKIGRITTGTSNSPAAAATEEEKCGRSFETLCNRPKGHKGQCYWESPQEAELVSLRQKVANQAERIRYLEGATNHASGTPLSKAERDNASLRRLYSETCDENEYL